MAALINQARLKQYLLLDYNVLFIGLHGVGKTAVIKSVFTEAFGERWRYFSASTLDPWVDFVGVPKVIDDPSGKSRLKLIRPDFIEDDSVEAIFFDEFNRAPSKVINAVMELLQFKSINGHKLNNLKVIWAAINPEDDDDTYSVDHLDPAHLDRFHVHFKVPYKVDEDYFLKRFPVTGEIFIQWWKDLPGDVQRLVSPRRLDYAAHAHANTCRLEDFLPVESNVKQLRSLLTSLPFHEVIKNITTDAEAEAFTRDINNATKLLDLVKANDASAVDFFLKYGSKMPKELIEPFAEFVYARKNGFEVVSSLEELIDKLPNDKGNQGTAAIINNVHLDVLYKSGGSLENDLRALSTSRHNLVQKLSNRICDVLMTCQAPTIERVMWGIQGKTSNRKTNFHEMLVTISKIGGFITPRQRVAINNKLYQRKIVSDMNYL